MFSPYQRPRIVEFPDPATGHITAGISVDSKSLEQSDIPALGTPITQIGLPEEFADKYSPEHVLTRILANDGSPGYQLIFEKLPGATLTGKVVTEKGQVATLTRQTVEPNTPVTASALTVTARLEPDGKGKSVLEKIEVSEVFPEKTLAAERPDPTPQKFQVAIPTTTEEETVAGTAVQTPTLGTGELAKSEQQLTEFTKRTKKTSRPKSDLPKKLPQTATGQQQQKLFVEDTLQLGETRRKPSITVDVESEALGDGTYVVRTQDEVEIFTGDTFSAETNDPTPVKFRSKLPTRTEERTEVGIARKPELRPGEVAKSFEQVDKHKVRRRTVKRPSEVLPVTLNQVETNQVGQKVAVSETLQKGDTIEEPTATSSIQSEALGDGNYVVRRTQLPEVFNEKSRSVERPDNVPQKFRASLPTSTEEEIVEGQVGPIALAAGEVAASEQQVTKFTKRKRRVSRQAAALPQTLTQVATNDKGQLVTVQETLQQGGTTAQPDATTQVESEALGDGTFIVRRSTVNKVFDNKQIQISIPEETMPERFRAAIPTEVVEETVTGDVESSLSLTGSEISKSEEQLTEHTKRTRRISRRATTSTPTLKGQNYDATLNVVYPYEEKITNSGASLGRPNTEVSPISGTQDLVREFNPKAIGEALSKINLAFPSRTSLTLPPVLKSIRLVWDITQEAGSYRGSGNGRGIGNTWSYDVKGQGEARSEAAVMPGWVVDIEEVWASGVPTTSHIFFLPYPVTENQILQKLGVARWPVFRPKSHALVAFGKKVTATRNASASQGASRSDQGSSSSNSDGLGTSFGTTTSAVSVKIPPCLHDLITIKADKKAEASASAAVDVGSQIVGLTEDGPVYGPIISVGAGARAIAESNVDLSLGQTYPTDIPRNGRYLIESRVEPYQYGFARVYAEVLDASIFG